MICLTNQYLIIYLGVVANQVKKVNKKTLLLTLLLAITSPIMASAAINEPTVIINNIKTLMVSIGSAIVVIGWVIAGTLYLTAAGAPDKTATAKKAMIASVIGTVIVIIGSAGYDIIATFLSTIIGTA